MFIEIDFGISAIIQAKYKILLVKIHVFLLFQVKIWFQNKRSKCKKIIKQGGTPPVLNNNNNIMDGMNGHPDMCQSPDNMVDNQHPDLHSPELLNHPHHHSSMHNNNNPDNMSSLHTNHNNSAPLYHMKMETKPDQQSIHNNKNNYNSLSSPPPQPIMVTPSSENAGHHLHPNQRHHTNESVSPGGSSESPSSTSWPDTSCTPAPSLGVPQQQSVYSGHNISEQYDSYMGQHGQYSATAASMAAHQYYAGWYGAATGHPAAGQMMAPHHPHYLS